MPKTLLYCTGVYPFFLVPSVHAVLAPNLWALPTQPYSRHEKWCWRLRASRSTITRLPSGSPASHSISFRSGAFGVGVGTAHGCTWRVGGTSAHPRSANDPSFGVRSRIHPHMRAHGPVRNTFTRGPAPASAASARSRLSRDLQPRVDAPRPPALLVVMFPIHSLRRKSMRLRLHN